VLAPPGQETSFAPPCSNLKLLGGKFTVLKKVRVTLLGLFGAPAVIRRLGNCSPLALLVTPLAAVVSNVRDGSIVLARNKQTLGSFGILCVFEEFERLRSGSKLKPGSISVCSHMFTTGVRGKGLPWMFDFANSY